MPPSREVAKLHEAARMVIAQLEEFAREDDFEAEGNKNSIYYKDALELRAAAETIRKSILG
jgi:hypothetical protein